MYLCPVVRPAVMAPDCVCKNFLNVCKIDPLLEEEGFAGRDLQAPISTKLFKLLNCYQMIDGMHPRYSQGKSISFWESQRRGKISEKYGLIVEYNRDKPLFIQKNRY